MRRARRPAGPGRNFAASLLDVDIASLERLVAGDTATRAGIAAGGDVWRLRLSACPTSPTPPVRPAGLVRARHPHRPSGEALVPRGDVVTADLARESLDAVVAALHGHGCVDRGALSWEPVDTAVGALVRDAERRARARASTPWCGGNSRARTDEDSRLSVTYLAFMVLATVARRHRRHHRLGGGGGRGDGGRPRLRPMAGLGGGSGPPGRTRRTALVARRPRRFLVAIALTVLFVLILRTVGLAGRR